MDMYDNQGMKYWGMSPNISPPYKHFLCKTYDSTDYSFCFIIKSDTH